jgi:hypothetical protein
MSERRHTRHGEAAAATNVGLIVEKKSKISLLRLSEDGPYATIALNEAIPCVGVLLVGAMIYVVFLLVVVAPNDTVVLIEEPPLPAANSLKHHDVLPPHRLERHRMLPLNRCLQRRGVCVSGWKLEIEKGFVDPLPQLLSHPILQGKPNASHMCARIKLHTHDRQ